MSRYGEPRAFTTRDRAAGVNVSQSVSHSRAIGGIGISPLDHRRIVRSSRARIRSAKRRLDKPDASTAARISSGSVIARESGVIARRLMDGRTPKDVNVVADVAIAD